MPKPYPAEFRRDVVRVALDRDENTTISQVVQDFGVHEGTLTKGLHRVEIDSGQRPGASTDMVAENRLLKRRNRLLEQELEVMRRAAAYFGQAQINPK